MFKTSISNEIQSERSFCDGKFIKMSRSNWKALFEVNFNYNSTNTIKLFALDLYEVTVDSACGVISYHHLIEILSS